jgi:hypothetical protein
MKANSLSISDFNETIITTKENIYSNFTGHIDYNTDTTFISLIKDGLLVVIKLNDKVHYCLNIFEKTEQIYSEMNGINSKLVIDIDQPLDDEFTNLSHIFTTEAIRAYPNRGKYYHCTRTEDRTFWITLVEAKGNSKSKRLIVGSVDNSKTRLYKIYEVIKIVARDSMGEIIIKKTLRQKHVITHGNTLKPHSIF